jgi:hypothetical protein
MGQNNSTNSAEESRIKLRFQLDSQSVKTIENLSAKKIKESIANDVKIFKNHRISVKG